MTAAAYSLRKHWKLSSSEILQFVITSVVAGFFLSFNDWGVADVIDTTVGFNNFFISILGVMLILGSVIAVQKLLGIWFGYEITYTFSWIGLSIGLIITILSDGVIPFFIPGGIMYDLIHNRRVGKYRSDLNFGELSAIVAVACILPLLWAVPFGAAYIATGYDSFRMLVMAALIIAVFSLIPTPNFMSPKDMRREMKGEGLKMYKGLKGCSYGYDLWSFSSTTYLIVGLSVLVFCGLTLLFNTFSFILSFILALIMIWIYKIVVKFLKK